MLNFAPGTRFERSVVDALRGKQACGVYTSDTLDIRHKVDAEIRSIGGVNLQKPVQVQLTKRVGHFGKFKAYMSSRWMNTDIVNLYVEVHDPSCPQETADHIAWAADETQRMLPYGHLPIFGLSVADGDAVFFDPYERQQALLDELHSPEYLAAFKTGVVRNSNENGLWIMDDDASTIYQAQYIDVFNSSFRRRLRGGDTCLPVRFQSIVPGRATDVRKIVGSERSTRCR